MKAVKLTKKEPQAVLYARVEKSNLDWLKKKAKEMGYKSFSAFMNSHIRSVRWGER